MERRPRTELRTPQPLEEKKQQIRQENQEQGAWSAVPSAGSHATNYLARNESFEKRKDNKTRDK